MNPHAIRNNIIGALALVAGLLAPPAGRAQVSGPTPAPTPPRVGTFTVQTSTHTLGPVTVQNNALAETRFADSTPMVPATAATSSTVPVAAAALGAPAGSQDVTPVSGEGLRFNFRGVALDSVLDYLSKAAGFIIIREAPVQGRVDIVSHRALNREEAVQVLNTLLNEKGFAAVRQNERTIKIMTKDAASKSTIPVKVVTDYTKIEKTDEMVTMIIPVRSASASQIIQNLEPLLPSSAILSANESSNAMIMTATQNDIRRMAEIISALDTSITSISTLKVFTLMHADATELAKLIGDLFKPSTATGSSGGRGGFPFGGPMSMMFGGRRGDRGGGGSTDASAARQAASQVTAVADTRTNSMVVSAPADTMQTIEELVKQIDTQTDTICEIRVFTLRYADASYMAQLINSVYQPVTQNSSSSSNQSGFGGFRRMMFGGGPGGFGGGGQSSSNSSSRQREQSTVLAVPDVRTNAIVVNADKEIMDQIAMMVQQLDNDPSRDKKVFVYPLKYADPEQAAQVVQDMFGDTTRSNRTSTNRATTFYGSSTNNSTNSSNSNRSSSSSGGRVPSGLSSGL